jgi:hypothetical protein
MTEVYTGDYGGNAGIVVMIEVGDYDGLDDGEMLTCRRNRPLLRAVEVGGSNNSSLLFTAATQTSRNR